MLEAAILCLTLNVYHESRGEDFKGQVAVAQVTLRRANYELSNVCKTVYKPRQFSWTHQNPAPPDKSGTAWLRARQVAILTVHDVIPDVTNGSTHYHEKRVKPLWRKSLTRTVVIGRHIFYRT